MWMIMNFLFSKWYMIKDDSRVGMLHTLCMCYFTLWDKFKRSKKSISSYQRLNKPPTKPALARPFWSFRSKCASPLRAADSPAGAPRQCLPTSSVLFVLPVLPSSIGTESSLTVSWDDWKVTQGIRFFFGEYLITRFSQSKRADPWVCVYRVTNLPHKHPYGQK